MFASSETSSHFSGQGYHIIYSKAMREVCGVQERLCNVDLVNSEDAQSVTKPWSVARVIKDI